MPLALLLCTRAVRKLSAPVVGLAGARAVKRFDARSCCEKAWCSRLGARAVRRFGAPAVRRFGAPAVRRFGAPAVKSLYRSGWSVWSSFILNDEIVVINDETCIFISVCC